MFKCCQSESVEARAQGPTSSAPMPSAPISEPEFDTKPAPVEEIADDVTEKSDISDKVTVDLNTVVGDDQTSAAAEEEATSASYKCCGLL